MFAAISVLIELANLSAVTASSAILAVVTLASVILTVVTALLANLAALIAPSRTQPLTTTSAGPEKA